MNIILCGLKNSGKTTIAKRYCEYYGDVYLDTDELILKETGFETISDCYAQLGHEQFRQHECQRIQSIQPCTHTLIATGGGTLLHPANVEHLSTLGKFVYLETSVPIIKKRLLAQDNLPRFIDREHFDDSVEQYCLERTVIFDSVCDMKITTDYLSVDEIIQCISFYRNHDGQ